jgi:hypothetical protein
MSNLETLNNVSNGAAPIVEFEQPFSVEASIEGTTPFLFHRWNCESVEAKSKAAKGSKAKKTDDLESYVYRNQKGHLAIPGEYFRQAIIHAAKFIQDPRSPRKSAMDLFKAAIIVLDELCSLGTSDWSYLDQRRVLVQRNGITRIRPAMATGWKVITRLQVVLPEYVNAHLLNDRLQAAGRLIGVGDFRPSYGRFQVVKFDVLKG